MYVAIIRMEFPEPDHDTMVKLSMNSTPRFTAARDDGRFMKYYISGAAGLGSIYIGKTREEAEAW